MNYLDDLAEETRSALSYRHVPKNVPAEAKPLIRAGEADNSASPGTPYRGTTARLDWGERLIPRRFAEKFTEAAGCWEWQASRRPDGYGQVSVDGRMRLAHRVLYEVLVGPIPDGLESDHVCRERSCVNPDHLEPVTHRENVLRGQAPSALNARKVECQDGHPFSGSNLYVKPNGERLCRACKREWDRQWKRRKKVL